MDDNTAFVLTVLIIVVGIAIVRVCDVVKNRRNKNG